VPWLGVLPNTEAEIKLEYTSSNPELDSLIVLECNSGKFKFIENNKNQTTKSTNFAQYVRLKVTDTGSYVVKAYSILKGNIKTQIGQLKVESKAYSPVKTVRIIRVRRSNENDYATLPISKQDLISQINIYYKQAFVYFELDNAFYLDTLAIEKSNTEAITDLQTQVYEKLPSRDENVYYIFICSQGANTQNGTGAVSGNFSVLYQISSITATHELGHNLGLQHTFEKKFEGKNGVCAIGNRLMSRGATFNIMDYAGLDDRRKFFLLYQINHLKTK
jgi:hypothetical protein